MFSESFGMATNNEAELRVVVEGLRLCKGLQISRI